MRMLRVVGWTLGGFAVAVLAFLIATIRVVEPKAAATQAVVPVGTVRATSAQAVPSLPGTPALIVPVAGVDAAQLRSNWGEARGGGSRAHQGIDIIAPGGTPVIAAADGTVEKLFFSSGGGGITLYERTDDGGWMLYYAHLGGYAPGMAEGKRVRAGETIGYVGDTGNAGAGNHHLHFGVSAMKPGQRWWQGIAIDPYPLLAGTPPGR